MCINNQAGRVCVNNQGNEDIPPNEDILVFMLCSRDCKCIKTRLKRVHLWRGMDRSAVG